MQIKLTIIESPFAGKGKTPEEKAADQKANNNFLLACCEHSLSLGEQPWASHGFYPLFMNDQDPAERELGISFGYNMWGAAEKIVFYLDRGLSDGMVAAMRKCIDERKKFEVRYLREVRVGLNRTLEEMSEPLGKIVPVDAKDLKFLKNSKAPVNLDDLASAIEMPHPDVMPQGSITADQARGK